MTDVNFNLPKSQYERALELARREGMSLDQFIAMAVAEAISVLEADDYLAQRAARGSRAKYEAVLKQVKSRDPLPEDEPLGDHT